MTVPAVGAVVLAGGRGSRMGGVSKPALVVGGVRLIDRVLAAVHPIARVVVVGPPDLALPADVVRTREDPPGGGPVAALAAGVAAFGGRPPDAVVLLGGDLPFLTADAVVTLVAGLDGGDDGVAFADPAGRPQWMCSAWRYGPLVTRLRCSPEASGSAGRGASMRALVDGLAVRLITARPVGDQPPPWFDCDTEADLRWAEQRWTR